MGELARDVADEKGLRRFAEDEVGGRLKREFWAIMEAVRDRTQGRGEIGGEVRCA